MRVPRLHVSQQPRVGDVMDLDEATHHYLARVLRLRQGQWIRLFSDGQEEYAAQIRAMSRQSASVEVCEALVKASESPLMITLGLCVTRGERMDYAVQKSVELGVAQIQPLSSERTELRLKPERSEKRRQHWQKIAVHAAEQSGRTRVPQVAATRPLGDWLENPSSALKLILHPANEAAEPEQKFRPDRLSGDLHNEGVSLLVGPEGGFSDSEVGMALKAGFMNWTLGPRILRAETAPVAALTILQHVWGDL